MTLKYDRSLKYKKKRKFVLDMMINNTMELKKFKEKKYSKKQVNLFLDY